MRMAADHLGGDGVDHAAEIEGALLLGHAGVKHDLEQQVAKLVAQVAQVTARNGVGDLVGFLDGVWRDRREVLLQIPRTAAAGRAQRRHDLDEPDDIAGWFHGLGFAGYGLGRAGRR